MQHSTGWPWGPLGSAVFFGLGPFVLYGLIYGSIWIAAHAGDAICQHWGLVCR